MKMHRATRAKRSLSGTRVAFGQVKIGAAGLGTLAAGAAAVGALAIGALAIGTLAVKRGRIGRLGVEGLGVGRLRVGEPVVERERTAPRRGASARPRRAEKDPDRFPTRAERRGAT